MSARPGTSHDDLMDLASRYAYAEELNVDVSVWVNGKEFVVREVKEDARSGLDAFVFENVDTGELTVVFQGSHDLRDWMTNATLATRVTDAQFEAALAFFDDVSARFGVVSSVSGNSLGGGLAAYVAVHREVAAVTVNPAPVPNEARGVGSPDVTNYVSSHDVLDAVNQSMGLHGGVLGEVVEFAGTSRNLAFVLANHIGSDGGDPEVSPYDASMAVPFLLFHPDTVVGGAGGFGDRIDLDVAALTAMGRGLDRRLDDVAAVLRVELRRFAQEVGEQYRDLDGRLDAMEALVRQALGRECGPVREGLREVVEQVDRFLRSPLVSMPPPPVALRPVWSLHAPLVRELLSDATRMVDPVLDALVRDIAAEAFRPAAEALSGEVYHLTRDLGVQGDQLGADVGVIARRWVVFSRATQAAATAICEADEAVAAAIATRGPLSEQVVVPLEPWPTGSVQPMTSTPLPALYRQVREVRQAVAGEAVIVLVSALHAAMAPWRQIAEGVAGVLATARQAVDTAVTALRLVVEGMGATPVGQVATATGVDSGVRQFVRDAEDLRADFHRWVTEIEHEIGDVLRLLDSVPDLAHELRPELRATFLADGVLERARDSLAKCHNVVAASEVAFQEVEHQLAEHEARAIHALAYRAGRMTTDLTTTRDNLQAMIA